MSAWVTCAGCEFWAALALLVGMVGLVYGIACRFCRETPQCKACGNEHCTLASGTPVIEPPALDSGQSR